MKSADLLMATTVLIASSFGSSWGQNASTEPFETVSPSDEASMIGTSIFNMGTSYPSETATEMATESDSTYMSDNRITIPPTDTTTMFDTDLGTENNLLQDELQSLYLAETEYSTINTEETEETMPPTLVDSMDATYTSSVQTAGEEPEMDSTMDMIQDDQTMPPTQHDTVETTEMPTIAYSETLSPSIFASVMVTEMDTSENMPENGLTQVPSEVSTETGTEMESAEERDTMPPTDTAETESPSIAATVTVTESATTTASMLENGLTQVPSELSTETETEDEATLAPTETESTGVAGDPFNAISTLADADCLPDMPCKMCEGDCDDDGDCEGELRCFRRIGDEVNPVPGCSGAGVPGQDYCYMPTENNLRLRDFPCSVDEPCKVCEGDCDDDLQCEGDLSCFHKALSDDGSVPGCEGTGSAGLDYCYEEIVTDCVQDNDCPEFPCDSEPCAQYVCRGGQCVTVETCGSNICNDWEYCCNSSCGICAPQGGGCTAQFCEQCGPILCEAGDVCCNESCGICTPPQDGCTDEVCDDIEYVKNLRPMNGFLRRKR